MQRAVRFVLETYGLTEIDTHESVELAFSLDTAALTQGISQVFGACKNTDERSKKLKVALCGWREW